MTSRRACPGGAGLRAHAQCCQVHRSRLRFTECPGSSVGSRGPDSHARTTSVAWLVNCRARFGSPCWRGANVVDEKRPTLVRRKSLDRSSCREIARSYISATERADHLAGCQRLTMPRTVASQPKSIPAYPTTPPVTGHVGRGRVANTFRPRQAPEQPESLQHDHGPCRTAMTYRSGRVRLKGRSPLPAVAAPAGPAGSGRRSAHLLPIASATGTLPANRCVPAP